MKVFLIAALLNSVFLMGQLKPIKIIDEKSNNRLALYAVNETETDYDVLLSVKGTNFRQSQAKPRWTRVPATSKVLMKTLILLRGKEPKYTYQLKVNDSLSRRALKRQFTLIEVPPKMIKPKKQITIYTPADCIKCDSLVSKLTNNLYIFREVKLNDQPEVKEQLQKSFANTISLDSLQTPIVNLGGHLFTWITDYETLMEELIK